MVSRKINTDAIDENLLIASIGKSKIGTTTASILDGASQSQVKDTEEKEEVAWKSQRSQTDSSRGREADSIRRTDPGDLILVCQ